MTLVRNSPWPIIPRSPLLLNKIGYKIVCKNFFSVYSQVSTFRKHCTLSKIVSRNFVRKSGIELSSEGRKNCESATCLRLVTPSTQKWLTFDSVPSGPNTFKIRKLYDFFRNSSECHVQCDTFVEYCLLSMVKISFFVTRIGFLKKSFRMSSQHFESNFVKRRSLISDMCTV